MYTCGGLIPQTSAICHLKRRARAFDHATFGRLGEPVILVRNAKSKTSSVTYRPDCTDAEQNYMIEVNGRIGVGASASVRNGFSRSDALETVRGHPINDHRSVTCYYEYNLNPSALHSTMLGQVIVINYKR